MCDYKIILFSILVSFVQGAITNKCEDQFPPSLFSNEIDNGDFQLDIRDNNGKLVERFLPKEKYNIILKSQKIGTKFRNFEIKHFPEGKIQKEKSLGKVIYKNPVVESSNCHGAFKNGGSTLLSSVNLIWEAPEFPEKCVQFRARVLVDGLVYGNHHKLQKSLCTNQMYSYIGGRPLINDGNKTPFKKCCACGTASYLVTFRGLWNKTTHPRDWPTEQGQLHWTDPIGATHNNDYSIYHLGGQASQPVSKVCTTGDSRVLKDELMSLEVRENVKSLFSSTWMNGEAQLNEERSGYISVNKTHHLFSFISMMGPSPDWCTGLSGIDLCMDGCKWKGNLTIPLYPWDAGIRTGETYKPEDSINLDYPEPIRKIESSWMKGNPFTPNRPVAEVILQRVEPKTDAQCSQKPIEKVVEFHNMKKLSNANSIGKDRSRSKYNILNDPLLSQMAKALCSFSQWTNWAPCSVKCGLGETTRKRDLIKNLKNELCIQLPLEETRDCEGRRRNCDYSKKCSLLPWSTWSECSATCTKPGITYRTRRFANEEDREECLKTEEYVLTEKKSCRLKESDRKCDPIAICSDGKIIRCSTGVAQTRYFYHIKSGKCLPFNYYGCKGSLNNFLSIKNCEETCSKPMRQLPSIRKAQLILLQSQSSYTDEKQKSETIKKVPEECFVNVNIGNNCRRNSSSQIWSYNHRIGKCRSLFDFDCEGKTVNKFSTFAACMKTCQPNSKLDDDTIDKVDCKVSSWSLWGPCSSKCGRGIQIRQRSILRESLNGGTHCPVLFETKICFNQLC